MSVCDVERVWVLCVLLSDRAVWVINDWDSVLHFALYSLGEAARLCSLMHVPLSLSLLTIARIKKKRRFCLKIYK